MWFRSSFAHFVFASREFAFLSTSTLTQRRARASNTNSQHGRADHPTTQTYRHAYQVSRIPTRRVYRVATGARPCATKAKARNQRTKSKSKRTKWPSSRNIPTVLYSACSKASESPKYHDRRAPPPVAIASPNRCASRHAAVVAARLRLLLIVHSRSAASGIV